jgi:hypothetical protein
MAEMPAPTPAMLKRFEFLTVLVWIALIGAVLILAIDFQIKHAILQESEKAWERIDAVKGQARGASATANSNGAVGNSVPGHDGPKMEMGPVGKAGSGGVAEGVPQANGQAKRSPRARNPRVSGEDSVGDGAS